MDHQQQTGQLPNSAQLPQDVPDPLVKRPRVSEACGNCRSRKTKCDGRKPVCRACEQRNVESSCNYDYVRRKRARTSLESPESRIGGQKAGNQAHLYGYSYPTPTSASHDNRTDQRPVGGHSTASNGLSDERRYSRMTQMSAIRAKAPYHADGTAFVSDGNDDSTYGPTATVAFLRSIIPQAKRPALSGTLGRENSQSNETSNNRSADLLFERRPIRKEALAALPVRSHADNFLFCFWEFMHPLFPVLHKPTFERKYLELWPDQSKLTAQREEDMDLEEVVFMSTLNLLFAIGVMFSDLVEPAQKRSVAHDFFIRSRNLYGFDVLDAASISVVQMVFLRGAYLQSTPHANRSWNSIGLALRIAQALGLHLDSSSQNAVSQLEREMMRRIWHSCAMLDRVMAMSFGRPPMLQGANTVPVPAPIDDEYLLEDGEGSQPLHIPPQLGCFTGSCRLLEIMEEIIEFYNGIDTTRRQQKLTMNALVTSESLGRLVEINRRLDHFDDGLPDFLRVPRYTDPNAPVDNHILMQQQVLYCRFLLIRMHLLRPVLLTATKQDLTATNHPLSKPCQSNLDSEIILSCCEICVRSAHALISTLHEYLRTPYKSAAWHTVYFTFSSAIALLGSTKIDRLNFNRAEFEKTWTKCLEILRYYRPQITSAKHAIKILESAKAQVMDEPQASTDAPSKSQNAPSANDFGTPTSNTPPNQPSPLTFADGDPLNTNNLAESWYSQQLFELDWFDLQPVPDGNFFLPTDVVPQAQM